MKSLPQRIARPLAASVLAALCATHAAAGEVTKANNTDALNLTTSWSLGTAPTATDVALWDSTVTAANTVLLGADTSWQGIKLTSPGGAVTISAGNTLTLGSSGIDMGSATQNLSIAAPVVLGSSQSWNTGAQTLTVSGIVSGAQSITKSGSGSLILTGANTFSGGINLTGGTLSTRASGSAGTGTISMANGTTFSMEDSNGFSSSGTSSFPSNAISVNTGASVSMQSSGAANGYGGLVTGDATSTFNIIGTNQVSFSLNANTQQFGSFLGTVDIASGASLRFSASSNLNNGGVNTTFNVIGNLTARNTGTVRVGELKGTGTITGSSGADGTTTYIIGEKNTNSTFSGVISDASSLRIARVTKSGTGTLTLSGANTYTGLTTINGGAIALGANNVFADTGALTLTGGKLDLAGFSDTMGTLTLTAATTSIIDFGAGTATLLFSTITGTGALSVLNLTEGFDSFRVTNDPAAILANITVNGGAAMATNMGSYWEITASQVPEPSTYAALAGLAILGFAATRRRRA